MWFQLDLNKSACSYLGGTVFVTWEYVFLFIYTYKKIVNWGTLGLCLCLEADFSGGLYRRGINHHTSRL